jgi:hypothetical protein
MQGRPNGLASKDHLGDCRLMSQNEVKGRELDRRSLLKHVAAAPMGRIQHFNSNEAEQLAAAFHHLMRNDQALKLRFGFGETNNRDYVCPSPTLQ